MGGASSSGTQPTPASASSQTTSTVAARRSPSVRNPRIVDVSPPQQRASAVARHGSGSSPVGFVVGLLLVVGVLVGGLTTIFRRRSGAAGRA
jgi:hypothetical protein